MQTREKTIEVQDLEGLPVPVAKWLKRSGVIGKPEVRKVWLSQKSQMQLSPEKEKWHSALSEQVFNVDQPAFTWKVRMKAGPVNLLRGTDTFQEGKGSMRIKLFNLFAVVNEQGAKIDEGSIQRFLGEIAWFPSAALKNYITWFPIDDYSAKAIISSDGTNGEGVFYFTEEGDFKTFSAMRYKGNDPESERHEWVITADEYRIFEGTRIPSHLNATWKLEDNRLWTWLKMEITDITYN